MYNFLIQYPDGTYVVQGVNSIYQAINEFRNRFGNYIPITEILPLN